MDMKKFVFSLIFILTVSIQSFSQTERDQKLGIRNNTSTPSTTSPTVRTQSNQEILEKNTIRRTDPGPRNPTIYPPVRTPRSFYRWNRWGAPYDYFGFYEFQTFDRWGYRYPVRVYQRAGGINDTVRSRKNKVRLGVNFSTNNEIGGWFTVGKAVYLKGQFNKIISTDKSQFYDNPNVNFYNASTVWSDQRLNDITKGWSVYLGVGREFKNLGVNLSLGVGQEQENFQFFDEYYILSNNGNYSFKNFVDNYVTTSVGLTHDYKFLSVSADFDPIRKTFWLGAGFNF